MKNKLTCKKCGRNYKMLADGICFYCNQEHWFAYFKKFEGKIK